MKKIMFLCIFCFLAGLFYDIDNLKPREFGLDYLDAFMYIDKKKVVERVDTAAYRRIVEATKDSAWLSPENSFYYSLLMSAQYNYPPAYYDVYHTLTTFMNGIDTLDVESKKFALAFLRRGAKLHEPRCIRTLKQLEDSVGNNSKILKSKK